jgi:hypothetical protein
MFTFETADEKEVRRFRMAQFNGRTATVKSGSGTIIGHVRSVQEQDATVPPRWTITIVPSPAKPAIRPMRPAARQLDSVIEDLC